MRIDKWGSIARQDVDAQSAEGCQEGRAFKSREEKCRARDVGWFFMHDDQSLALSNSFWVSPAKHQIIF